MIRNEELFPGVTFFSVQDTKFKHNRMTVRLLLPLDKTTASANAIVPFLLRKGCKSLPDFTRLNQELCRLYGASLSCDVSKINANQILELSVVSIDDKYALGGEDITGACAKLLMEVLFAPALDEGGLFPKKEVELEKQQLVDAMEGLLNDKRAFALKRCKEELCGDDALAIDKYGDIPTAQALTPEMATEAYHRVLKTAKVELSFAGCGAPDAAREVFRDAFAQHTIKAEKLLLTRLELTDKAVRTVEQPMDVTQGKLVLGFRTAPWSNMRQQMAFRLMSALYGGTPNSRLFVYVREKLSLCYYCAARYEKLSGLLLVDSGVEFENRDKAQREILNQLEVVCKGEFTDEEFTAALLYAQNALSSVTDSLGGTENWYFTQNFQGTDYTPSQESALLSQVTKEDIVWAAKNTRLDTIYFLTGKEAAQ